MTTNDTIGVRFLKHGLCTVTIAMLLTVAFYMAGQVFERGAAEFASHAQDVNSIAFKD